MKWLFLASNSQFSSNESGTESWWIDRKRFACRLLAAATRLTRLGRALPSVKSNLVSAKPSAFNFSSIRCARRRLKTNSATLRALIAPSDSAVSHIQNDPEFRGIAHCCDRGKVQGDRPQGGKLYSVGLWRGDVLWRFAVL